MRRLFNFLLILLIPTLLLAQDKTCEEALTSVLLSKVSKAEAQKFLNLQGQLTMHRMAWNYLWLQKKDETEKLESIETTILSLLDEKYTNTDPAFVLARNTYEDQPLSRTSLARIMPYVSDLLEKEIPDDKATFAINLSDLKMLDLLAIHEKQNSSTSLFDHRMQNVQGEMGMLNFVKIINSSLNLKNPLNESDFGLDLRIKHLEGHLHRFQKELESWLNKIDLPEECSEVFRGCHPDKTFGELFFLDNDLQDIVWQSLKERLASDDVLFEAVTYGKIWLKTKSINYVKEVKPVDDVKNPPYVNKPQVKSEKSYTTSTGLWIKSTDEYFKKNYPYFKAPSEEFIKKVIDSKTQNNKIILIDGKIYDLKNLDQISLVEAIQKYLPPTLAQNTLTKINALKQIRPGFSEKYAEAVINGEKTIIYNNELYDLNLIKLSPEKIIAEKTNEKLGTKRKPEDYAGMDKIYLVKRADAILNTRPTFKIGEHVFDTLTGRAVHSPFRSTASVQDVKIQKEERVVIESLSDEEKIINHLRMSSADKVCQNIFIVDKKKAEIRVYDLKGNLLVSKPILLGSKKSDKRTIWTKFDDIERSSNSSTGAGVFTFGEQKIGGNYQKNYNNNIIEVYDHTGKSSVMAIHQVPNNLTSRNHAFNSGNPLDRRLTGGCLNLIESDFLAIKKYMKSGCSFYVLPEEEGNSFVVRNNKITFTSTNAIPSADWKYYAFNHSAKSYPIDIKIIKEQGKTNLSEKFVQTLEEEKEKLMKVLEIDNDDYNDLAILSYAIMGNESDFGKSKRLWTKEFMQNEVIIGKIAENIWNGKSALHGDVFSTSRGYTQIKYLPNGKWQEAYPEVKKSLLPVNIGLLNPFVNSPLLDARNSAIATMAYLADALKQVKKISAQNKSHPLKPQLTRESLIQYIAYIYTGRTSALSSEQSPATPDFNKYVQNLRKHMAYIEVTQRVK